MKILILLLVMTQFALGQYPIEIAKNAGTVENTDRSSAIAWTNPTNAQGAADATYAVYTADGTTAGSDYLVCRNYGFLIPNESQIVYFWVYGVGFSDASPQRSSNYRLQNHAPSFIGNAKTSTLDGVDYLEFWVPSSVPDVTDNTTWDMWGVTGLYPWSTRAANFGLRVYVTSSNTNGQTYQHDAMQLAIAYYPPTARVN